MHSMSVLSKLISVIIYYAIVPNTDILESTRDISIRGCVL